jgi:hypothetical protein
MTDGDFNSMQALKEMSVINFYHQYNIWKDNLPTKTARQNAKNSPRI